MCIFRVYIQVRLAITKTFCSRSALLDRFTILASMTSLVFCRTHINKSGLALPP